MVFKRRESIEKPNEQPLNEQAQTDTAAQPSETQKPVEEQQPAEPQTTEQAASEDTTETKTEAEQPQTVSNDHHRPNGRSWECDAS